MVVMTVATTNMVVRVTITLSVVLSMAKNIVMKATMARMKVWRQVLVTW